MSTIEYHNHGKIFEASGAADVVSIPLGNDQTMLLLSGVAAEDPDGVYGQANVVAPGIQEQVDFVWNRISDLLAPHGATLQDIVKVTFYATDTRYLMGPVAASVAKIFADRTAPAATGVTVTGLAWPELLIEIDVTAVVSAR